MGAPLFRFLIIKQLQLFYQQHQHSSANQLRPECEWAISDSVEPLLDSMHHVPNQAQSLHMKIWSGHNIGHSWASLTRRLQEGSPQTSPKECAREPSHYNSLANRHPWEIMHAAAFQSFVMGVNQSEARQSMGHLMSLNKCHLNFGLLSSLCHYHLLVNHTLKDVLRPICQINLQDKCNYVAHRFLHIGYLHF